MVGDVRGERVVPLARKDRRQALLPDLLEGGQDADLVVHEDVVPGRVLPLDVLDLTLLVDVDQHAPLDRLEQAGALDLARLEHDVAVGQDHRRPPRGEALDDVERGRIEAVGERVLQEERGQPEHVRIVRVLHAVALQRPQVVGVAELGAQRFEDRPVALLTLGAERARQVPLEIGGHPVVVEQGVVDVEQEHDTTSARPAGGGAHLDPGAALPRGRGGGKGLRGSRSGRVAAL